MKIAFVRMKYVPYGGAENYLTLVGNELVKKGHEVHIFSNRWNWSSPETGSGPFIFHKVPVIKITSFLKTLSFAIYSYILIKKDKFDIILSFDRVLYQDIYRAGDGCHREWLEKRKLIESPLKIFLTKINPFHRTVLCLEKRIYQGNGSRRIVTNSFKGRDDIIRYYKTPEDRITVIYNGVDLDRFKPSNSDIYREGMRRKYGISDNDVVILFVGSGFERKGLRFLFEGISLLDSRPPGLAPLHRILRRSGAGKTPDPPASLRPMGRVFDEAGRAGLKILVVGKGDYKYYEKIGRRLGIGEDIIFAGTTNEIERFYAASDIFVLPTIYDPFSNACLEAMASGLSVITTKNNGASEIIEDGRDGFILENPADTDEISSRIKLLMDDDLRKTIGEKARKKAEGFSIEDTVRKMVGICG